MRNNIKKYFFVMEKLDGIVKIISNHFDKDIQGLIKEGYRVKVKKKFYLDRILNKKYNKNPFFKEKNILCLVTNLTSQTNLLCK